MSVGFRELLYWNLGIMLRVRVTISFGVRVMDGIQVPDNYSVRMNIMARIIMRVRYTLVFQGCVHCSVDIIGSVWVMARVRVSFRVRNRLRMSLPVYWGNGLMDSLSVNIVIRVRIGFRMYIPGLVFMVGLGLMLGLESVLVLSFHYLCIGVWVS